jgi:hypothetical protein
MLLLPPPGHSQTAQVHWCHLSSGDTLCNKVNDRTGEGGWLRHAVTQPELSQNTASRTAQLQQHCITSHNEATKQPCYDALQLSVLCNLSHLPPMLPELVW